MKACVLFLLYAAMAEAVAGAPVINVAVVVAAAPGATFPDTTTASMNYFCTKGNLMMSTLCPYSSRVSARGGFTVGNVTGVTFNFTAFRIGTDVSAATARSMALASDIPNGVYGNFPVVIVTTPRTMGDALMWGSHNALGTNPTTLFNVGIADTKQFTNPNTSLAWFPGSFGALVPNNFGFSICKLIQAVYAVEKAKTGVPLTYTVLSGSSSSSLAVVSDIMSSVTQSESGVLWFGTNFIWPSRAAPNETQADWDARVTPWAQSIAAMSSKPDVVFVAGLSTEAALSRTLLAAWETIWLPKYTILAGSSVPLKYDALFRDVIFALQWHAISRGIGFDVKETPGAGEPWVSDPASGLQAPQVFDADIQAMPFYPTAIKAYPVPAAIGVVPVIWAQKAAQIGCRDVTSIDQCTGKLISQGAPDVSAPSAFGMITSANGQISSSSFWFGQVADDLTQTFLSPSDSSNGTLRRARTPLERQSTMVMDWEQFYLAASALVALCGGLGSEVQYAWLIMSKRKSSRAYSDTASVIAATSLAIAVTLFCTQSLGVVSRVFKNFAEGQDLIGYKGLYLALSGILCLCGASFSTWAVYVLTDPLEARGADDSTAAAGGTEPRVSTSSSSTAPVVPVKPTPGEVVRGLLCIPRKVRLPLKMLLATSVVAACTVASPILLIYSVDGDAVPSIDTGAIAGAVLLAWFMSACAPYCVFLVKRLREVRIIIGGVASACSGWLTVYIVYGTTTWTRNITNRAALDSGSITAATMFGMTFVMFLPLMLFVVYVLRKWFKGDITFLEEYGRAADERVKEATLQFIDCVLRANVDLEYNSPGAYPGQFKWLPGMPEDKLTPEGEALTLDAVLKNQAATAFFLHSATRHENRHSIECLLLTSAIIALIDDDNGHRTYASNIINLIVKLRRKFFETGDINVENEEQVRLITATMRRGETNQFIKATIALAADAPSDSPGSEYDEMVEKLIEIMPTLRNLCVSLVRGNQWAHLTTWHRNHMAKLVRGTLIEGTGAAAAAQAIKQTPYDRRVSPNMPPVRWSRGLDHLYDSKAQTPAPAPVRKSVAPPRPTVGLAAAALRQPQRGESKLGPIADSHGDAVVLPGAIAAAAAGTTTTETPHAPASGDGGGQKYVSAEFPENK